MATRCTTLPLFLAIVSHVALPLALTRSFGQTAASPELTLKATVLLPDGSPAAGAIVRSHDHYEQSLKTATTDASGRFELRDPFLIGVSLHVLSADERHQAALRIAEEAVRSALAQPLTIKLQRAKPHLVVVTAGGEPIEGAHVCVTGSVAQQKGVTRDDGAAIVWLPADETVQSVVAWHPQRGVNGIDERGRAESRTITGISLLPPGPHLVRLVDNEGHPVAGRTITVSIRAAKGGWILTKDLDAARAVTDQNGEVRYDWFPAEPEIVVDVDLLEREWKIEVTDREQSPNGLTTVHVRRRYLVEGRLELPPGVDAAGILLTGSSFGPGPEGDAPQVRTRKDGSFCMDARAAHAYVLGVYDLQWTSNIWSGVIIPSDGAPQNEIVLRGERATPLKFQVTRGPSKQPIADAWLDVSRLGTVEWTNEKGEAQSGIGRIGGWVRTDDNGLASTAVGRGEIEIRINSGKWSETKTLQVLSDEPLQLDFHRDWVGRRVLKARPIADAKKYVPSPEAVALAWTKRPRQSANAHKAIVTNDGLVRVEFDEYEMSLLLIDRQRELSGYVDVGANDREVDLPMQPNASYSGTLVDRQNGSPLAARMVRMLTKLSFLDVAEPQQTDAMGRFAFANLPAGVPLRLSIGEERGRPEYFLFEGDLLFQPGEQRTGDVAKATLTEDDRD